MTEQNDEHFEVISENKAREFVNKYGAHTRFTCEKHKII